MTIFVAIVWPRSHLARSGADHTLGELKSFRDQVATQPRILNLEQHHADAVQNPPESASPLQRPIERVCQRLVASGTQLVNELSYELVQRFQVIDRHLVGQIVLVKLIY